MDIFANDVGFIAIADSAGRLAGFNVTAGGGMGVTHDEAQSKLPTTLPTTVPVADDHVAG